MFFLNSLNYIRGDCEKIIKTRETQCLYLKDNETNLRYSEIIDDDDGKNAQTELLF